MGVSMGVSSWVEVVWHAGRWHQLGAAAHKTGCAHAADPPWENTELLIVGK